MVMIMIMMMESTALKGAKRKFSTCQYRCFASFYSISHKQERLYNVMKALLRMYSTLKVVPVFIPCL